MLSIVLAVLSMLACAAALASSSKQPPIKAVLFDVDGTLSDSFHLGYSSTIEVLKLRGASITEEEYHAGTKYTTPRRLAWHVTGDPDNEEGIELGRQFDTLYVDLVSVQTAPLYEGILPLLDLVAQRQVRLGALSNACGAYVRAVVRANRLEKYFSAEVQLGADDVPAAKPRPEGLLHLCASMGLRSEDCVYIGDSPSDGAAARAAGMRCVGVTYGSHPEHTVRPAFDHTVASVQELYLLLEQMLS